MTPDNTLASIRAAFVPLPRACKLTPQVLNANPSAYLDIPWIKLVKGQGCRAVPRRKPNKPEAAGLRKGAAVASQQIVAGVAQRRYPAAAARRAAAWGKPQPRTIGKSAIHAADAVIAGA